MSKLENTFTWGNAINKIGSLKDQVDQLELDYGSLLEYVNKVTLKEPPENQEINLGIKWRNRDIYCYLISGNVNFTEGGDVAFGPTNIGEVYKWDITFYDGNNQLLAPYIEFNAQGNATKYMVVRKDVTNKTLKVKSKGYTGNKWCVGWVFYAKS